MQNLLETQSIDFEGDFKLPEIFDLEKHIANMKAKYQRSLHFNYYVAPWRDGTKKTLVIETWG